MKSYMIAIYLSICPSLVINTKCVVNSDKHLSVYEFCNNGVSSNYVYSFRVGTYKNKVPKFGTTSGKYYIRRPESFYKG